jgi:hypothetical protein
MMLVIAQPVYRSSRHFDSGAIDTPAVSFVVGDAVVLCAGLASAHDDNGWSGS